VLEEVPVDLPVLARLLLHGVHLHPVEHQRVLLQLGCWCAAPARSESKGNNVNWKPQKYGFLQLRIQAKLGTIGDYSTNRQQICRSTLSVICCRWSEKSTFVGLSMSTSSLWPIKSNYRWKLYCGIVGLSLSGSSSRSIKSIYRWKILVSLSVCRCRARVCIRHCRIIVDKYCTAYYQTTCEARHYVSFMLLSGNHVPRRRLRRQYTVLLPHPFHSATGFRYHKMII
jgi:hypothetical protein